MLRNSPLLRSVFFGLAEWILFFLLWLLFVNTTDFYELLIGAGSALLAAIATEVVRACPFARFKPSLYWIIQAWRLPWYIIEGCAVIFWVLLKHFFKSETSVLRSIPFDAGDSSAASSARRALAITYTTMPPNFVVLSIDLLRNRMIVHQVQPSDVPKMTQNLGAKA